MIELLLFALAALATVGVISIAILTFANVISWFKSRNNLDKSDKDILGFTIGAKMAKGEYKIVPGVFNQETDKYHIVQGIYNQRTGRIVEHRAIESENLDSTMQNNHESEDLVLYT